MADVVISEQGRGDVRATTHVLARAFDDDEFFRWMVRDPFWRYRALRRFFGAGVVDGRRHGLVNLATEDGLVVGAAIWLPPRAYPPSGWREPRQAPAVAATGPLFPRRLPVAARLLTEMQRHHPKDEHWYLAILG